MYISSFVHEFVCKSATYSRDISTQFLQNETHILDRGMFPVLHLHCTCTLFIYTICHVKNYITSSRLIWAFILQEKSIQLFCFSLSILQFSGVEILPWYSCGGKYLREIFMQILSEKRFSFSESFMQAKCEFSMMSSVFCNIALTNSF